MAVADIVRDCTDTSEEAQSGEKEPWLLRKTRYPGALANKPETSDTADAMPQPQRVTEHVVIDQYSAKAGR